MGLLGIPLITQATVFVKMVSIMVEFYHTETITLEFSESIK